MTRERGTIRPGRRLPLAAAVVAVLLSSCAKQGITYKAHQVHDLYRLIFLLALPVFVVVEGLLLWNVIPEYKLLLADAQTSGLRDNRREHRRRDYCCDDCCDDCRHHRCDIGADSGRDNRREHRRSDDCCHHCCHDWRRRWYWRQDRAGNGCRQGR